MFYADNSPSGTLSNPAHRTASCRGGMWCDERNGCVDLRAGNVPRVLALIWRPAIPSPLLLFRTAISIPIASRGLLFPSCSHGRGNPRRRFRCGLAHTARCAWGKREGMKSKRECHYTRELDLETLVWTRGPNFPLSSLDGRLMCPRCKSRRVAVLFQPPTVRTRLVDNLTIIGHAPEISRIKDL